MSDIERDPDPGHGRSTRGVHAGAPPPSPGAPVVPPVVQSATFYGGGGPGGDLLYSRYGNNPNQMLVARKMAALCETESALALASGMAATAMTLLALTRSGDHVVASERLYGATKTLLTEELPRRGVDTTFVDPSSEAAWREAVEPGTRVLFHEIPTNPTLRVYDPRPVARLARQEGLVMVADATFASPINLRPASLGVDIVIHSATKYLGGHSDLIAGVVAGRADDVEAIRRMMMLYGPSLDPHAAWLLDRGLRTLDVRVRRQNENAFGLARFLEGRPEVERVVYPGLESHPDHALATELLDGYGGMVSMVLAGGGAAADRFMDALAIARVAPSLGGVETLVSQPRYTSHRDLTPGERARVGIPDGFVRISVGIEDLDDLVADVAAGLAAGGTGAA